MAILKGGVIAVIIALILMYAPLQGFYATTTGNAIKNVFNNSDFIGSAKGNSTTFTILGSTFVIGAFLGFLFDLVFRKKKNDEEEEESEEEIEAPEEAEEREGAEDEESEEIEEEDITEEEEK